MLYALLLSLQVVCSGPEWPAGVPAVDPAMMQEGQGAPQEEEEKEKKEEEKPPVYPDLTPLQKEQVKRLFVSFKNRNPEKRKAFEQEMIAIGRAAIPSLLERGDTKHESEGECIFHCLMALMDERDAIPLKSCYASKADRLRLLAVLKISAIKKPAFIDFLKKPLQDGNPEIRIEAALGLARLGDPSGMGEIILKVAEDRDQIPPGILENLPSLKGKVYGSLFGPFLMAKEEPDVRIAAVQVIMSIGDLRLKPILIKALDDPHNLVKTAAVNALRKLVNGAPPRQFKNVFELVEEVEKWKRGG